MFQNIIEFDEVDFYLFRDAAHIASKLLHGRDSGGEGR